MESLTSLAAKTTPVAPKAIKVKNHKLRIRSLADPAGMTIKTLIFGPIGSGKTYTLVKLLLLGYRVFVLSTDFGGNGLLTVKAELKHLKREDLWNNLTFVDVNDYETTLEFLEDPTKFMPDFYDKDFDFLFWDGFSNFQLSDVMEYVGEHINLGGGEEGRADRDTELRESGYQFDTKDWNAVKNATLRPAKKFLALQNVKTGKIIHKIVTCQESVRPKKKSGTSSDPTKGTEYVDEKKPLLSGQAGILSQAGFDLVLKTVVSSAGEDDGDASGARKYEYVVEGNNNLAAKKRGIRFSSPIIPADFGAVWQTVCEQAGIVRGAVSSDLVERNELPAEASK